MMIHSVGIVHSVLVVHVLVAVLLHITSAILRVRMMMCFLVMVTSLMEDCSESV